MIQCWACESTWVHIKSVHTFFRERKDGPGQHLMTLRHKVKVDQQMTRNPSRETGITIFVLCAECKAVSEIHFLDSDKGVAYYMRTRT